MRRSHAIRSSLLAGAAVALVGATLLPGSAAAAPEGPPPAPNDATQLVADTLLGILPPQAVSVPAGLPGGTKCYTARANGWAKAKAGNTLFTFYTVGGWCYSGNTVLSSWFVEAGGETSTPGWRYKGVRSKGSGVAGNEGRTYSQHNFVLGIGGWDVQHPTPCVRVKGLAEPRALVDTRCGVH